MANHQLRIFRNPIIYFLVLMLFVRLDAHAQQSNEDIFKSKYIKNTLQKVTTWQLQNPKHRPTDWTNGAFYAGVVAAYQTTKAGFIRDSLLALGERTGWQPGPRYDHADDIAISQTYIDVYRMKKDRKMIQGTIDTVQKLRTVPGPEMKRHGITWWWCDALFMAPPTLAKLAVTLKDPSYLALNDSLFRQTYDLLYNTTEHLFARDASYLVTKEGVGKREKNGKLVFWSRGNGWVMGGLVRLLEEMPTNHPTRNFYLGIYREMAEKIITLQQQDGLWRASLLDPESYPGGEGSGSGFYCYALAWGINRGLLPKDKYLPAVQKAWTGLNTLLSPDGRVGWVQPIGADPQKNFSAESWEVYGAGAFLLAGSEVIKLKR
ncbi:glycoside hydrolase family 105 protein [Segetibacter sp. 3557_3]|uniref:glycoside hydrolase family 88/105 protein n=1 Tax=Segetibacter sp. 3557_3 TaxID=2547429 RepID=UPI001A9F08DC|nr:glycoside hydrolase family 88 protein [Segetibacter sp. 3557_3]